MNASTFLLTVMLGMAPSDGIEGLDAERNIQLEVRSLAISSDGKYLYQGSGGGGVYRYGEDDLNP